MFYQIISSSLLIMQFAISFLYVLLERYVFKLSLVYLLLL